MTSFLADPGLDEPSVGVSLLFTPLGFGQLSAEKLGILDCPLPEAVVAASAMLPTWMTLEYLKLLAGCC